MTDTGGTTTPAGWYTDPGGSGHLRWWDGAAWTAHLAPQEPPAPVVAAPVVVAPVLAPTPTVQLPPVEQPPAIVTADNQPYVPFQGSWNTTNSGYGNAYGNSYSTSATDFARPAQWNTVGAWLLAFSGLLLAAAVLIALSRGASPTSPYGTGYIIGSLAIPYLITLAFAEVDRRKLRSLGYLKIPSLWWMLLAPPLVYLIVRTVYVWGEVRAGAAPLITNIVVSVASSVALVVIFTSLFAGALLNPSQQFAASLEKGLDEKGGHFTVSCPTPLPAKIGAFFACTATDSAGTKHSIGMQVTAGTNGLPDYKLMSVTPKING